MDKNIYVCPECGGELAYWREWYLTKYQFIDSKTGILTSKTKKTEAELNASILGGLECLKCGWDDDTARKSIPKHLIDIFDDDDYFKNSKID